MAAFLAGLAKKGEDGLQDDQDFWTNLQLFLIVLSTTLAATSSLHEPDKKEKSWKCFKLLLLAAMIVVNWRLLTVTYSKKGDKVSKDAKTGFADQHILLYLFSSVLSGGGSFTKLVSKKEELALDDQDLELGKKPFDREHPSTLLEYKEALEDRETSLKTVIIMMEKLWSTNHRLVREIGLFKNLFERVEFF